ncbi:CotH kinase family protein [Butyrivibrio sp. WCD2001]|uniref:CotH kinase family protein n=1 Tax=Butyrivibrio sp. WCD2001 TaxID=1280681 RepID=UPI0018CB2628|nr:CotH kinase family protein [Butyrivibrio sp. WCD2001]
MKCKIFLIIFALLAIGISLGAYFINDNDDAVISEIQCYIQGDEKIKLFREENTLYAFVPSGITMNDMFFSCNSNNLVIDGKNVNTGDSFSDIDLNVGNTYKLKFRRKVYDFVVLKSENVSTFFISNASGDFTEVIDDKKNKEPIRLSVLDVNGNNEYSGIGAVKGRGNSTWVLDKKPFNLYFDEMVSLLGFQESNKYCLLANGYDQSNLRNKLVYDFAKRVESKWTPSCDYVDLYINGEYYGLYLLSESVEVSENKINIGQDSGYWYSMSIPSRLSSLDKYVITDDGRIVEVKYSPKKDCSLLLNHLNEFEQNLKDGNYEQWIDLDSWSTKYLIEEIFLNSDIASMYFYWDDNSEDSIIYAGPQWDYDNALGNAALNRVKVPPTAQLLSQASRFEGYGNTWFCELAKNKSFISVIENKYREEYRPLIDEIINDEFDQLTKRIEKASYSNSVRWKSMYDSFIYNDSPEEIKNYLIDRISFLNSKWIDNEEWISVRLNRGAGKSYLYYSKKIGDNLNTLPNGEEADVLDFSYWEDEYSGEKCLSDEKLCKDTFLKAIKTSDANGTGSDWKRIITKENVFCFGMCFLFSGFLVGMAIIDWRRNFGR